MYGKFCRRNGIKMIRIKYVFIFLMIVLTLSACNNGRSIRNDELYPGTLEKNNSVTIDKQKAGAAAQQVANPDLALSPDVKRIIDRGRLIVGIYAKDMPPFFMADNEGKLYGYDIDIAKEIAHTLNVEI